MYNQTNRPSRIGYEPSFTDGVIQRHYLPSSHSSKQSNNSHIWTELLYLKRGCDGQLLNYPYARIRSSLEALGYLTKISFSLSFKKRRVVQVSCILSYITWSRWFSKNGVMQDNNQRNAWTCYNEVLADILIMAYYMACECMTILQVMKIKIQ